MATVVQQITPSIHTEQLYEDAPSVFLYAQEILVAFTSAAKEKREALGQPKTWAARKLKRRIKTIRKEQAGWQRRVDELQAEVDVLQQALKELTE